MRATLLCLAFAIAQIYAIEISQNCLEGVTDPWACCKGVPPTQDVLLRNPKNCGTYYQCVHESPMLRDCPSGLHWSVSANRCEWPHLAGCGGNNPTEKPTEPTKEPTPEPTPTEQPSTPGGNGCGNVDPPAPPSGECIKGVTPAEECCKGVPYWRDVLLPNPEDCGSYLQCVHEKPMVRPCPEGLHWSIENNRCEWPNIAKCENGGSGGSGSGEGGEGGEGGSGGSGEGGEGGLSQDCLMGWISPDECCKGVPYNVDVLFKNPEDCGTYYQCVHEKPMVRPCPAGLHWGVKQNRCEWQDIAQCENVMARK